MNKILKYFNKLIAFWVALFGIIAFIYPALFTIFDSWINIFFGAAMFGIGLMIKEENYRNILKSPGTIIFGTLCQFSIMPLLALFTSWLFNLSPAWTVGLI